MERSFHLWSRKIIKKMKFYFFLYLPYEISVKLQLFKYHIPWQIASRLSLDADPSIKDKSMVSSKA